MKKHYLVLGACSFLTIFNIATAQTTGRKAETNHEKGERLEREINDDISKLHWGSAISKRDAYIDAVTDDFFSVSTPTPKSANGGRYQSYTNKNSSACANLLESSRARSCDDLFNSPTEKKRLGPARAPNDYGTSGGFLGSGGVR